MGITSNISKIGTFTFTDSSGKNESTLVVKEYSYDRSFVSFTKDSGTEYSFKKELVVAALPLLAEICNVEHKKYSKIANRLLAMCEQNDVRCTCKDNTCIICELKELSK